MKDNGEKYTRINKGAKRGAAIYLAAAAFVIVVSLVFLVLFSLTYTEAKSVFFDKKNFSEVEEEIGGTEKEDYTASAEGYTFYYYKSVVNDDDFEVSVTITDENGKSEEVLYKLKNAEMLIRYYFNRFDFATYDVSENGMIATDKTTETYGKERLTIAGEKIALADKIIEDRMNNVCTVGELLSEYREYCDTVRAVRIAGITVFSILFVVGCGMVVGYSISNKKKTQA